MVFQDEKIISYVEFIVMSQMFFSKQGRNIFSVKCKRYFAHQEFFPEGRPRRDLFCTQKNKNNDNK